MKQLSRWLTGLTSLRPSRVSRRGASLHLEQLEARCVPSASTIGAAGVSLATGTHRPPPAPIVTYHNGLLIPHMEVQGVYLGSTWNTPTGASNVASLDNYLSYIVNSPYTKGLTRAGYAVGAGTASPGVVDPLKLGRTLDDSQIQSDLRRLITAGRVQAPDPNRIYVIYVGQGTEVTFQGQNSINNFLGYHYFTSGTNALGHESELFYAVIPYQAPPNATVTGYATRDSATFVTAHELAETATDPDLNGWKLPAGNEICDLPNYFPAILNDGKGDSYVVAQYVDQNGNLYPLGGWTSLPGTTTTLSATASTIARGQEVTFTITVVPVSGAGLISGTIDLLDGNKKIGTATLQLVDGVETATIRTTLRGLGAHVLDAVFAGDKDYRGGFSDPLNVQVT
jgi:hypothetical protein